MRIFSVLLSFLLTPFSTSLPYKPPTEPNETLPDVHSTNISFSLFQDLEELSRIVDISYCVGTTGIHKPFLCASRCHEFPHFELVDIFNTGPLMSDSCGYIALDHGDAYMEEDSQRGEKEQIKGRKGRIIVAFRGTYSIANTIVDLSTVPQEYISYPDDPDDDEGGQRPLSQSTPPDLSRPNSYFDFIPPILRGSSKSKENSEWIKESPPTTTPAHKETKCLNCTVHSGFWTSWQNTRPIILDYVTLLRYKYPDYDLHLVGHSLGGAVAALAGMEFQGYGWNPTVTTFGEPKIGNQGLRDFVDWRFELLDADKGREESNYRRVTHVDDPVPLLPLKQWDYLPHAGEVYIEKTKLQPERQNLRICYGDEDDDCIAQAEKGTDALWFGEKNVQAWLKDVEQVFTSTEGNDEKDMENAEAELEKRWGIPIPARYRIWQLFFAHRDYFWRLGLCVPGGDPINWGKHGYEVGRDGYGMGVEEL